ncbi:MAG: CapA family protein, partial [Prevotella sp.]|nr:CapA family protein [Prevotella sp.]
GAGENMQQAAQPILIDNSIRPIYIIASQRLPLENFAYLPDQFSISQEPWDSLLNRVQMLRQAQPTSYIIVSLHWGWEHQTTPTITQRQEAHQLIDAGANALVCHHTHTLQTIEEYHGCPIYYSIGNFIFDQNKPINTRACIVKLHISAKEARAETIPINIISHVPRVLEVRKLEARE